MGCLFALKASGFVNVCGHSFLFFCFFNFLNLNNSDVCFARPMKLDWISLDLRIFLYLQCVDANNKILQALLRFAKR